MSRMRTTLTIDDDLMKDLREAAQRHGLPFKQLVNQLLRLGLERMRKPRPRRRYRCPTFSMGQPAPGVNLDKAIALAGDLEDEEVVRRIEMRK